MNHEPDCDRHKFWSLDRTITYLNHGAFGACPIPVLEVQQRWRQQLESEPTRFFGREYEDLINKAREKLAAFIGADAEDVVFVPNATTGVNTVLRSLVFQPGDELLTTNHEYNACRNALDFVAQRDGAKVVIAEIPFPLESTAEAIEAVIELVSARTKLVLLDHITSSTALVMPIEAIIRQLTQRGIDTLIDGAHALGAIPLNLRQLGATYYSGNCHKWLCAPKGAGFLYVRRDKQAGIRPLTISHGANSPRTDISRFHLEFDWTGTQDPTAYLCVGEAIEFMESLLPGGWPQLMAQNHQMAIAARDILCDRLGIQPPIPEDAIGTMASIPIPDDAFLFPPATGRIDPLQDRLFEDFQIEVPIFPWYAPRRVLRVSAQLYNTLEDYKKLDRALEKLRG
ncbi:aminotransferase class V-fold PLP-dependent enzyme [Oscillatoriales cyanobacterium LEGE 11467]|uniref:Aminotransferase class V-fold PLP-dependent enzyme n=1 Tax=Zarconia navalis LEGE 11467 TaxID=1828826 RepID=A0A928VV11_9CYAN|nr:aminotransferase class V-fold PLP-dependent enzyme [Zarconia navalis]MBE9040849.1 aminotransferase class V-fold PLP-dependent enzyme [Zarconia navalis LEGE 11467]